MADDPRHFHFNVGNTHAVCVEGGSGHGQPELLDSVTIALRTYTGKGHPGAREAVSFYVRRSEIAAIGLAFLDVAARMAPETIWARSDVVASPDAQQRRVMPLSVRQRGDVERFVDEAGEALARALAISFEKLRRRIHTLQRLQHLLERVDDEVARQLELLLVFVELEGHLPFAVEAIPVFDEL